MYIANLEYSHIHVFMGEAMTLRDGLALVWSKGYREVIREVDCEDLLNSLHDA